MNSEKILENSEKFSIIFVVGLRPTLVVVAAAASRSAILRERLVAHAKAPKCAALAADGFLFLWSLHALLVGCAALAVLERFPGPKLGAPD